MNRRLATLAGAGWAVLMAAGAVSPQATVTSAEDLTFKVQSQLVQIYVSVTEGTRRVTDLAQSDFALEEDGNSRPIERLDSATVPLHVALLLDTSGSMGPTLTATQQAALTFVDSLQPTDRVSFIPFSSDVQLIPQLTDDRTPIQAAIRAAQAHGSTKLYDALLFAMKHLAGVQGRRAVVVFSDGEDNARTSSLDLVLNAAARHGFPIYTIAAREALRTDMLRRVLRQLAEINRGRMFIVDDPRELHAAFTEVANELRAIFVVNYYTDVPQDGRWHDVKVSLLNPKLKAHARQGFFARSGANAVGPEGGPPPNLSALQLPRIETEKTAKAATDELVSPTVLRGVEEKPVRIPASVLRQAPAEPPTPLFKVETRFVEVPVLVESTGNKDTQPLSEKDFRIYEDDKLRDIAFFSQDVGVRLAEPRAKALSKLNGRPGLSTPITAAADTQELKLGRYYLVVDDMLTPTGAFLQVKRAAEGILREFRDPLRPMSVHLLSDATAEVAAKSDPGPMIEKIRKLAPRVSPMLTSNDGIVTVYEAFLIDRGDRDAQQLAELRYASSISAQFRNELGEVDGQPGTPADQIRMMVSNQVRQMLSENMAQLSRALDGLRAVLNAASADQGDCPKDVILLSSGFTLGRASQRSDLSFRLQNIIAEAKRGRTRVHAVDASGLENDEAIGARANASFLLHNPHLMSLLMEHARGWRIDRQDPLAQLANETGGRFLHSTNDLGEAVDRLIDTRGRIYYLGFLSQQPADGAFHSVRVTVSDAGARVHARKGYFAQASSAAENTGDESAGEDPRTLFLRARQAQASGNMKELAAALEPLARRFPTQMELWYNLGLAHFRLANYQRAVEALQRAYVLSPDDRSIGLPLSRALVAAGYRSAAVQTLQLLARRQPDDVDLLMDLGRAYESDGRLEDAYQVYRHILDLSLAPPLDVYLLLARTSAQLGRHVEARIFVDDYLSLGGSDTGIAQWRALLR